MDRNPDVEAAIIRPMQARFSPPRRLQADEDALADTLNAYREALDRFDRPTLDGAWRLVAARNETWCWPKLRTILDACHEVAARAQNSRSDGWVEQATQMSDAYVKRFLRTSQVAVRARAEGWEGPLKAFVREASWVQGQYLAGREGVGYSSSVLFPNGEGKEEREEWFAKQREQAARGFIRVSVPVDLQRQWKAEAEPSEGRGR